MTETEGGTCRNPLSGCHVWTVRLSYQPLSELSDCRIPVVSLSYPVGNLLSFCRTRAQAFLNPTVAMEKDFEGLTEKDLEELERSALACPSGR